MFSQNYAAQLISTLIIIIIHIYWEPINILELFRKDHVIQKTGVMMIKKCFAIIGINYDLKH